MQFEEVDAVLEHFNRVKKGKLTMGFCIGSKRACFHVQHGKYRSRLCLLEVHELDERDKTLKRLRLFGK